MTDAWKWPAELVGGPLDGTTVEVEGSPDVLRLPVPPRLDSLTSDDLTGPEVAVYELVEREYLDVTGGDALLRGVPDRPTIHGKYRWKP